MSDQRSQISSIFNFERGRTPVQRNDSKSTPGGFRIDADIQDDSIDPAIYGNGQTSDENQIQISYLQSLLQMQTQRIERLEAEIRSLTQIQQDQQKALEMALTDRRELEKQLAQNQGYLTSTSDSSINNDIQIGIQGMNTYRPESAHIQNKETPYFLENSMFLRAFIRHDQSALNELIKSICAVSDQHTRGQAAQALFSQMQRFMQLNSVFDRLSDEMSTDTFVSTFEQNARNLIDSRRIILWARIQSAHVIVSRSSSIIVPEEEGLLGKVIHSGQRLVVTEPSRDPSYSLDYDGQILSNARVTCYQPVVDAKKDVLWVIQIIDRFNAKGSVVSPTTDDFVILDFLTVSLLKLSQEETRVDEMIRRILTESTRSLITERQVLPLLETVQLTVTHLVGCQSLEIFFTDPSKNTLFKLVNGDSNPETNLSTVNRVEIPVDQAGIAAVAYKTKKIVNVAVVKEHQNYNADIDGKYPDSAAIAVPLLSSKGTVSLIAVARQKQNGMIFTNSDEIILEALSKVSQGALSNAQSHERNISEIQKALNNHKYYTALLAVAQELSAVLDTDTLVRKIMSKAQSFIGADRCSLFLVDKVSGGLWSMVAHGTAGKIHVPLGQGIAGHVASTGETLNIPDAYKDPRFNVEVDKSTGYKTHSILCVPIRDNVGNIIGCTQMINKLGAPEFSIRDVELMTAFNVFCGIALSNAQLFEAAMKSKKKMTAMLEIALSLSTSPSLDALVSSIMARARELIEAEVCTLFLYDRKRQVCKPLGRSKFVDPEHPEPPPPAQPMPLSSASGSRISSSVNLLRSSSTNLLREQNRNQADEFSCKLDAIGYVAVTGTELNLKDPMNDKRFTLVQSLTGGIEAHSGLVIPVIDGTGQIVGVVNAWNKMGAPVFNEEDQSLLRAFASFAGLALDRFLSGNNQPVVSFTELNLIETLSPSEMTAIVPSDRLKLFDPLLSKVEVLRFDPLDCSLNDQYKIVIHIFSKLDILNTFGIPIGKFLRFLESSYNEFYNIPFHNWNYAILTTQFLYFALTHSELGQIFSKLELFALMVAGICNDMGNSGRASLRNSKAQIPLSILYKDNSVIETLNCSTAINIISLPSCNILSNITDQSKLKDFWTATIDCMLSSDANMQQKLIEEAETKLSNGGGKVTLTDPLIKKMVMKLLLRCAVLSGAARPFDEKEAWGSKLLERGFLPNEENIQLSSPITLQKISVLSDKEIAKGQYEFTSKTCVPIFTLLGRLVPDLRMIGDQVRINMNIWAKIAGV